jgi:hypothetical protein
MFKLAKRAPSPWMVHCPLVPSHPTHLHLRCQTLSQLHPPLLLPLPEPLRAPLGSGAMSWEVTHPPEQAQGKAAHLGV